MKKLELQISKLTAHKIAGVIVWNVIQAAGGQENLQKSRQDDETRDEYLDRLYGDALDLVNDAIVEMEKGDKYSFFGYDKSEMMTSGVNHGEPMWFDEARDEAVSRVVLIMEGNLE